MVPAWRRCALAVGNRITPEQHVRTYTSTLQIISAYIKMYAAINRINLVLSVRTKSRTTLHTTLIVTILLDTCTVLIAIVLRTAFGIRYVSSLILTLLRMPWDRTSGVCLQSIRPCSYVYVHIHSGTMRHNNVRDGSLYLIISFISSLHTSMVYATTWIVLVH